MTFRVDLHDFKRLTRDLEKVSKVAVPYGVRNGLNALAFEGRRIWQEVLGETFILRNDWTTRRLHVDKATGTTITGMRSVLASPDAYIERREESTTEDHSVPTGVATGEGRSADPRRRLVRKPNRVSVITLGTRPRTGSNPRQRNAIAVRMAIAAGNPFVFLSLGKRRGIFRVTGGRRTAKVDLVWDTRSKTHHVKAMPTLGPSITRLKVRAPAIMEHAFVDQLRRAKVFGY